MFISVLLSKLDLTSITRSFHPFFSSLCPGGLVLCDFCHFSFAFTNLELACNSLGRISSLSFFESETRCLLLSLSLRS